MKLLAAARVNRQVVCGLEVEECLQVGNVEVLNCYYAHADQEDGQQVRLMPRPIPEDGASKASDSASHGTKPLMLA